MTSLPDVYPEQPGFKDYKDRYVLDFTRSASYRKLKKISRNFGRELAHHFKREISAYLLRAKFQYYLDMRFKLIVDVNVSV